MQCVSCCSGQYTEENYGESGKQKNTRKGMKNRQGAEDEDKENKINEKVQKEKRGEKQVNGLMEEEKRKTEGCERRGGR